MLSRLCEEYSIILNHAAQNTSIVFLPRFCKELPSKNSGEYNRSPTGRTVLKATACNSTPVK